MSWLARLKNSESPETGLTELTKALPQAGESLEAEKFGFPKNGTDRTDKNPPAPPSVSFVSAISGESEFFEGVRAGAEDSHEPTAHCPACGSPSWWRAPSSPAWSCAYCEPRDRSRVEAHETLTLHSGRWRSGTAPPVPTPTTVAELLALHGEIIAGCRTLDVLEQADDSDLSDLRDRDVIAGFACALTADRRVRPLPDPTLSPLGRLALELGDDPAELRAWLDQSAVGRRCRQRIEREPLAIDRCLIALRDDPDGPLLLALARALAGDRTAEPAPDRPADGHVRNPFGAWRTVEAHAAVAAYDAHHWRCTICQRAGQGYGDRCPTGAALHAATRAHT